MRIPQPSFPSASRHRHTSLLAAAVLAALGAAARAQQQFADLRGLPPGVGVAVLGDVDGDGDLDIVGAGANQDQVQLFLNDGTGVFTDATAGRMPVVGEFARAMAFGDVDGDGDLDLVLANYPLHRLYLNDGAGTFTDVTAARLPSWRVNSSNAVALGDVDGDGDLDIVGAGQGWNHLFLNDGAGTFTDVSSARLPRDSESTYGVALGDVDGDGDLDVVCANSDNGNGRRNRLYRNDGTGTFADVTAGQLPAAGGVFSAAVAMGDVDGDSDLDLVFGTIDIYAGAQNRLYLNDGAGTFTDATANLPAGDDIAPAVALGDLDGDGDLDIVFGNYSYYNGGEPNRLFLNDGAGRFTDATAARMSGVPDWTCSVALGDVDGDGDPDILFGNRGDQNRLESNMLRQLHAPARPQIGQSYRVDVYARYGPPRLVDVALPYLSLAPAAIPLPPFGTLGIDANQSVALPAVVVPQPAGIGAAAFAVPYNPGLVGIPVHLQALLIQYPVQARLTNVVHGVVQ